MPDLLFEQPDYSQRQAAGKANYDYFRSQLPALLADPANVGKHALVQALHVHGVYATEQEAEDAGYDKFGLYGFLVQPIISDEDAIKQAPYCSRAAVTTVSNTKQIADLIDTIRWMIGMDRGMPWREVPIEDAMAYVRDLQKLKYKE